MPKTVGLEIEEEIVRDVARGDKQYLRKSADREAQISSVGGTNALLNWALRSAGFQDFSGSDCVYHLEDNVFFYLKETPLH